MPLYRNTSQPYFPDPNSPNAIDCLGDYCWPVADGDSIMQQWYQTPCGNNEISDPTFEDITLGSELIINGNFQAVPASPPDGTSWTSSPGGAWTTSGGVNSFCVFDASFPLGTLINVTPLAITPGNIYQFEILVTGLQVGDVLNVYLGSNTPTLVIDSNSALMQVNIIAGSDNTDIVFEGDSANNIIIDNISLKEITFGSWDSNGQWNLTADLACKTTAGTGILEEVVADYIVANSYYYLDFTISNYGGGTLVPKVSNAPATVVYNENILVDHNGFYRLYFLPTVTGVVSFIPSSDFIGCISGLDLRLLRNDFPITLIDPDGNSTDISLTAAYFEDKITIMTNLSELGYDHGCGYRIELLDSCLVEGDDLISNGAFTGGISDWLASPPTQFSVVSDQAVFTFDPLQGSNLCTNGDFSAGGAGWTSTGWVITTDATHTPGNTSPLSRSVTIGTPATPPSYKVWWIGITMSGRTAGSIQIQLGNATLGTYQDNGAWAWKCAPTIGGSVTFQIIPTSNFDGTIDDLQIYEDTTPWIQGVSIQNPVNTSTVPGNYEMTFDVISVTGDGPGGAAGIIGMAQNLVYHDTPGTYVVTINNYVPGTQIPWIVASFGNSDTAGGVRAYPGEIIVDNIELVRVEPFDATFESECINFQNVFPFSKLFVAYSDQNNEFDYSNTGFRLQQRIECKSDNPIDQKEKQVSKHGDGSARVTYASREKYWRLTTTFMSEAANDCLSAQVDQDHFIIGETELGGTEYVAQPEDGAPAWRGEGDYSLAAQTLQLRLKTAGMKFNRHT